MAIVSIRDLTIGFRGPPLLDEVNCRIEAGERIGLLGRNGAGKTTFMRLLCGELEPDGGKVEVSSGVRVARLQQEVPVGQVGLISDVVAEGMVDHPEIHDEPWKVTQRIERMLAEMELDGSARFETLSSGMKRRVLLARSLVIQPDVLLLDEPTNHLDLASIQWLESFLIKWPATLIFVTHDRVFLRRLANRILEIDRGQIFDWSCDYDTFLRRKEEQLAATDKQDALFDKRLAEEERWIRQGVKARRTRNEGRVKALESMRETYRQRRKDVGQVRLRIDAGQRSGALVSGLEEVCFSHGEDLILRDFSLSVMRGDKIGIMGPNGAGKTTLLRILLGQLKPDSGQVRLGTNLTIAYFDQLRQQLDEEATVQHNVSDGYDHVHVGGKPQHVIGYLQGFLFSPERSRTPIKFLSGGERNRVLLAKLFAKPANTIVLDEPTNDLDAETLELLEQRLVDFDGTVLLVSHDREFLNNVVTSTVVFEEGEVNEYAGGYDDWVRQRGGAAALRNTDKPESNSNEKLSSRSSPSRREVAEVQPKRLSYQEKRELEGLPSKIESLEAEIAQSHARMADASFYQQSGEAIAAERACVESLEVDLKAAYERWQTLEGAA